jgi:glycosyltransferase involved in cell wall biosynthesis
LPNPDSLQVAVLTTSFPLEPTSTSGIFVQRLVQNLPSCIDAIVVTPCASKLASLVKITRYKTTCFKYAPRTWQVLAHEPGGIPVALRRRKALILLLPVFLGAMFIACLRVSRTCNLIHANWSVNGLVAGMAGIITGTPVITTLRGADVTKAEKSKLYEIILRLCLCLSKKLIAVSEAIYNQLSNDFPEHIDKLVFLPNGVDQSFLKISHRDKSIQSKNNSALQILTIGSLIPRKGIKDIIEALGLIKEQGSTFEFKIIGAGTEEDNLKQLAISSGISDQVHFLGNISPQEIPHHFAKADLFVLASYSEGRPNVILESLAAGVPVIATQIDGVIELIKENITGLLFTPGDALNLAKQINRVKDDQAFRHELAQRGKELILGKGLLWPNVGVQYAEIYNQVILGNDKDRV